MKKSLIVDFIRSHPDDWMDKFEEMNIRVKTDGNLAIFNYGVGVDFSNPLSLEARGIIIDYVALKVRCWAFNKFFNSHEVYADTINWANCRVEDKIDGSIIKLWYYEEEDEWRFSTNSVISSFDAMSESGYSYGEIIQKAINYDQIPFDSLDKYCTYIFELVSPFTQVVIHYPTTKLYHIGTRSNLTGEEFRVDIGIEQPITYPIHTLDDCLRAAELLNDGFSSVRKEGFVVVDDSYHRIKIKSPWYLQLHHAWNNGNISRQDILRMVINGNIPDDMGEFPQLAMMIKYYEFRMKELEYYISQYIDYVRGLYVEFEQDRKAVANAIKNNKYAAFGFAAIGNSKTAEKLLLDTKISTLLKIIPDYERNI